MALINKCEECGKTTEQFLKVSCAKMEMEVSRGAVIENRFCSFKCAAEYFIAKTETKT